MPLPLEVGAVVGAITAGLDGCDDGNVDDGKRVLPPPSKIDGDDDESISPGDRPMSFWTFAKGGTVLLLFSVDRLPLLSEAAAPVSSVPLKDGGLLLLLLAGGWLYI